jgi:nucleoside 2-deoxyribosyltransferase
MKNACAKIGLIGVFPMDAEIEAKATPQATGFAICAANIALIESCDALVADLSPFRGPSADVGTVWEFAYAQGLGKVVAAYSSDGREYKTRVSPKLAGDDTIEDFGMRDNLMLEGSLAANGSCLHASFGEAVLALAEDLTLYLMLKRKRNEAVRHLSVCR